MVITSRLLDQVHARIPLRTTADQLKASLADPGFPFGTYTICADDGSRQGHRRRGVANTKSDGLALDPDGSPTLKLRINTSTSTLREVHVSRRQDERGFTIVELLVAMMVLGIVVAGAMTMMQVVLRQSRGTVERTDAMQRGRLVARPADARDPLAGLPERDDVRAASPRRTDSITFYSDFERPRRVAPAAATGSRYDPAAAHDHPDGLEHDDATGPIGYPGAPASDPARREPRSRGQTAADAPAVFIAYTRTTQPRPPIANQPLTPRSWPDRPSASARRRSTSPSRCCPTRVGSTKDDFGTLSGGLRLPAQRRPQRHETGPHMPMTRIDPVLRARRGDDRRADDPRRGDDARHRRAVRGRRRHAVRA